MGIFSLILLVLFVCFQCEDVTQPEHPLYRMYRTRPGAFARVLSRGADVSQCRVVPGSTFASLMEPPTSASREEAGAFECCIQGAAV